MDIMTKGDIVKIKAEVRSIRQYQNGDIIKVIKRYKTRMPLLGS